MHSIYFKIMSIFNSIHFVTNLDAFWIFAILFVELKLATVKQNKTTEFIRIILFFAKIVIYEGFLNTVLSKKR